MAERIRAYEIRKHGTDAVLNNLRPSVSERHRARQPSAQLRRPGNDPAHLDLIRRMQCTLCTALSRIDPHHLKSAAAARERAFGRRSTDRWALPLCRFHHDEVERAGARGEQAYFAKSGIDPCVLAVALFNSTGDLSRMGMILMAHKQLAIRTLKRWAAVNALMAHGLTRAEAEETYDAVRRP